eukprot:TRINITY_DN9036_c0_g4_i1.p1 TRINITY_DN9036_c0_g4~~TRINITY_DN9036_c0_g4_i1.p1  ORF type:complete len:700 (-),score=74.82 TRINITY_DN9036_c0_g4_i1:38-2137(-)
MATASKDLQKDILEFMRKPKQVAYVEQARRVFKGENDVVYIRLSDLPESMRAVLQRQFLFACNAFSLALLELARSDFSSREQNSSCFAIAVHGLPVSGGPRKLRSERLGQFVAIRGIVRRIGEIRPERLAGKFTCNTCGRSVFVRADPMRPLVFRNPVACPDRSCSNKKGWTLREDSKANCWSQWQAIRLQEHPCDTPAGLTPGAIDVILRAHWCGHCQSGDSVSMTGCLAAVPSSCVFGPAGTQESSAFQGRIANASDPVERSSQKGLSCKLVFVCSCVGDPPVSKNDLFVDAQSQALLETQLREGEDDFSRFSRNTMTPSRPHSPGKDSQTQNLGLGVDTRHGRSVEAQLRELARAVAPSVHGHVQAKTAVLLMLLGGVVRKNDSDGSFFRGQIHVCLFGSSASAKSSLLRWTASFVSHSVYSVGASASAVGLTASYDTTDGLLHPGAIVGASGGICCIDDLDKMSVSDQVAINEAMDFQSISIAKAGLQAKLPVSTSVLAACSLRDDSHRQACGLSQSLASRFDLILPTTDDSTADGERRRGGADDELLARHIISLCCDGTRGKRVNDVDSAMAALSPQAFFEHIKRGRGLSPRLSAEAHDRAVCCYHAIRRMGGTPRHLESLLRLSEAAARACLDEEVGVEHVQEVFVILCDSLAAPLASLSAEHVEVRGGESCHRRGAPAPVHRGSLQKRVKRS